jgi:hypothetical protein
MLGSVWHVLGFGGHDKASAKAALGTTPAISSVNATVAANNLTLTINPQDIDFRSATLGSGTVNTRTVSSAITVVVPSGGTLGTTNALLSRVAILAIDNAGTVEVACVNVSTGIDLTETGVISTTAVGTGSDSAGVIYSTTGRTNVPYRVMGYCESTQATAGTWASAPSLIQGAGGRSLQRAAPVQSMVRLHTSNGYGSTNTKIRRFSTVLTNIGSDILYADSATLGATFTVTAPGVYAISYVDNFSTNGNNFGLSLNSTELSTDVGSIAAADVLLTGYIPDNGPRHNLAITVYLRAGDVVRAHTSGTASGLPSLCYFAMTRVA